VADSHRPTSAVSIPHRVPLLCCFSSLCSSPIWQPVAATETPRFVCFPAWLPTTPRPTCHLLRRPCYCSLSNFGRSRQEQLCRTDARQPSIRPDTISRPIRSYVNCRMFLSGSARIGKTAIDNEKRANREFPFCFQLVRRSECSMGNQPQCFFQHKAVGIDIGRHRSAHKLSTRWGSAREGHVLHWIGQC